MVGDLRSGCQPHAFMRTDIVECRVQGINPMWYGDDVRV